MRELKSVEEKILDRTLYLIGKNRSCDVSVRAIAKEANVNVSAINYYFRTKEEMLRQAKGFYINNTRSILAILDDESLEEEERLILFANETMEYILRYPGITVILREATILGEKDETSKNIIKITTEMHEKMDKALFSVIKSSEARFRYDKMIFMASIIYPTENSDIIDFDRNAIYERESRIEYIKYIINILKKA